MVDKNDILSMTTLRDWVPGVGYWLVCLVGAPLLSGVVAVATLSAMGLPGLLVALLLTPLVVASLPSVERLRVGARRGWTLFAAPLTVVAAVAWAVGLLAWGLSTCGPGCIT